MRLIVLFIFTLFMQEPVRAEESSFVSTIQEESFTPTESEEISSGNETYTLIDQLGEGAFGRVFSAKDSKGNLFAIKWYKGTPGEDDPYWERLGDVQREFEHGQQLNHPHIIKSFDLFQGNKNDFYLVLDLVKGKTVYRTKRKSITFNQALNYSLQLVDALKYAESQDLLYLDLHGNNLMMNDSKQIKIIDLASFFSWDEICEFQLFYFAPNASTPESEPLEKKRIIKALPPRMQKIQKFVEENPHLQKAMAAMANKKFQTRDNTDQRYRNLVSASYFNRVADACIDVIKKSQYEKEEKVNLMLNIKKLALTFTEEAQDGVTIQGLQAYMEELINIIKEKA